MVGAIYDVLLCGEVRITLQRQNAENLKQIFPETEYRGLSPNFNIHASVSELYSKFSRWVCLFCWRKYVDRSWEYTYKSLTDAWMWKLGLRPRYSQERNIKSELPLQCREMVRMVFMVFMVFMAMCVLIAVCWPVEQKIYAWIFGCSLKVHKHEIYKYRKTI